MNDIYYQEYNNPDTQGDQDHTALLTREINLTYFLKNKQN